MRPVERSSPGRLCIRHAACSIDFYPGEPLGSLPCSLSGWQRTGTALGVLRRQPASQIGKKAEEVNSLAAQKNQYNRSRLSVSESDTKAPPPCTQNPAAKAKSRLPGLPKARCAVRLQGPSPQQKRQKPCCFSPRPRRRQKLAAPSVSRAPAPNKSGKNLAVFLPAPAGAPGSNFPPGRSRPFQFLTPAAVPTPDYDLQFKKPSSGSPGRAMLLPSPATLPIGETPSGIFLPPAEPERCCRIYPVELQPPPRTTFLRFSLWCRSQRPLKFDQSRRRDQSAERGITWCTSVASWMLSSLRSPRMTSALQSSQIYPMLAK